MAVNNFKELERETIAQIGSAPEEIERKISHNLNVFRFIGDLIELYIPNFGRSIISMTGGRKEEKNKSKYPHQQ